MVRSLILVGMLGLAACIDDPTFDLPEEPQTKQSLDPATPAPAPAKPVFAEDAGATRGSPGAATPAPPKATTPTPARGDDGDDGKEGESNGKKKP